jgi:DNA-binding CsgD family transcriptional regulator
MNIDDLSETVMRLTDSAIERGSQAHQENLVSILQDVVRFDSAYWGWSSLSGRNVLVNTGLYGFSTSFESAFRVVEHLDPFIRYGRNLPVFAKVLHVDGDPVPEPYRNFLKAFDVNAMLNGHCKLSGDSEFNFFMSVMRKHKGPAFTEADRHAYRLVLRHIEQSLSLSLRTELRKLAGADGEAALFHASGLIVRATRGFRDMLAREGLSARESTALLIDLSLTPMVWHGRHVRLESREHRPGLTLIRLGPNRIPDVLSRAERRIADGLAAGRTMRQIAEDNGVSHNTVRNQVSSIYRKIGARNRVEFLKKMGSGENLRT